MSSPETEQTLFAMTLGDIKTRSSINLSLTMFLQLQRICAHQNIFDVMQLASNINNKLWNGHNNWSEERR